MKTATVVLLLSLSLASLQGTNAQGTSAQANPAPTKNGPITVQSSTLQVTEVTEAGKKVEKLTDVSNKGVFPQSLLQLSQKISNSSKVKVKNIKLDMAVPAATAFQSQQCNVSGATVLYSIDGKNFAAAPLKKKVTVTENGKSVTKEVEVKPSEYTHIRWQLPEMGGNSQGECFIRVVVK